jgi:ABC-type sulfate/molybdate transport systems ATPase subunit
MVASHERERAGALADRVVSVVAGQVSERSTPDHTDGDQP